MGIGPGVWPESMSFSDEGLGPIPSKWKGICQNDVDRSVIFIELLREGSVSLAPTSVL